MVLTRAQAAARAAEQAQDVTATETSIVEHPGEATMTALPTTVELEPGVEDHLARLAEHFLAQTQALTAGHRMLQTQQEGQSQAQCAALMAIQASAETGMKQLTAQQQEIVVRFQEELLGTQSAIREQLLRLQAIQEEYRAQIQQDVDAKLTQAVVEVQRVSEAMVAAQSDGTKQLVKEIDSRFVANHDALDARTLQVEEQLKLTSTGGAVDGLAQDLTKQSLQDMKAYVDNSLELGLKLTRDELQQELLSTLARVPEEPLLEAVKQLVLEETTKSERQVGVQVQRALATVQGELNLATQRQADATNILREQF
ncbi:hypothetical protein PHYBOEH_007192 [Phytophthora boehmeriae]|uniref:Uncharacterized protein n=1 Tax=Phytophthora boehmeriae TaxID=109152 RepID=A0A8T1WCD5_9STRA|nr:hypothetical protein PHYBOEH_007192 [Phytophthora boehmeriae]